MWRYIVIACIISLVCTNSAFSHSRNPEKKKSKNIQKAQRVVVAPDELKGEAAKLQKKYYDQLVKYVVSQIDFKKFGELERLSVDLVDGVPVLLLILDSQGKYSSRKTACERAS